MTDALQDFFCAHAEQAIEQMKRAIVAEGFYRRLDWRIQAGEDLSYEVPLVSQVGPEEALAVVREAIKEYGASIYSAWDLPQQVNALGKLDLELIHDPNEHLPRADMRFVYACDAAEITVRIQTAGENYQLRIESDAIPMAAKVARQELDRAIGFALLAN
jgi:hypothetical protein